MAATIAAAVVLPRRSLAKQCAPCASKRGAESLGRRHEDVGLSGLDLLQRPGIQIRQLRELLLGDASGDALTPQVRPKELQLMSSGVLGSHALSCRKATFDRTARHAVKRNASACILCGPPIATASLRPPPQLPCAHAPR